MITTTKIPIQVENKSYDVFWNDLGHKQMITVFQDGHILGSKEFTHLTDNGQGVIEYVVKSILRETGLKQELLKTEKEV